METVCIYKSEIDTSIKKTFNKNFEENNGVPTKGADWHV